MTHEQTWDRSPYPEMAGYGGMLTNPCGSQDLFCHSTPGSKELASLTVREGSQATFHAEVADFGNFKTPWVRDLVNPLFLDLLDVERNDPLSGLRGGRNWVKEAFERSPLSPSPGAWILENV